LTNIVFIVLMRPSEDVVSLVDYLSKLPSLVLLLYIVLI